MKKLTIAWVLLAATVAAASVHFVTGPTSTDIGTTLAVTGKLAGLGVGDVTILVSASGLAETECTNPAGNVAPGQDTVVTTSGSVTLPAAKNGTLTFTVVTAEPVLPSVPTCPNPQWSAEAIDVIFSSGTITVLQGGVVVLQQAV